MTGDPLKIGVLISQTGITSIIERTQLAATQLAVEEVNSAGGVRGRQLQIVAYDPASDPALYRKYARRIVEEDGISIVFGCYMSSARRAILPIIERNNALLCYPTFYEGFEYSENVLYFGSVPNQTNRALADLVLERFGDQAIFIGSDYLFPRESNRSMHNILARRGGKVLGEIYVPLNAPDSEFEAAIASAHRAGADFIFSTVVGSDIPKLYSAFHSRGLKPAEMPIVSVTATEAELANLPAGAAAGHITAAPYFSSLPSAENQRFVRKFRQRFGTDKMTNMCAEASYISVHLTAHGIRLAGTDDPRALARALHGVSFEAPQGPVKVDAENNHCYLFSRIGRMREDGEFDILWESAENTKPDPYFTEGNTLEGEAASPQATVPLFSPEMGA